MEIYGQSGAGGTTAEATHSEQSKIKSTEAEEHLNVFKDVYACAVGPIIFFVFSIKKFCLIRMISFTLQFIVICVLISIEAKRFGKASEKWQQSLFHLSPSRSARERRGGGGRDDRRSKENGETSHQMNDEVSAESI